MRTNVTGSVVVRYMIASPGFFLLFTALVFACMGFAGCRAEGAPGMIHFSPDGSTIAHTYIKRIDLPLPPEMPTLYSTVYLQWCPLDQLKS